jgi:oxygen-dependent protoporphyrinogen oxidase
MDRIAYSRRHFLKTVLLGAAGANLPACRRDSPSGAAASAHPIDAAPSAPISLGGEIHALCHRVRDGEKFATAAVSATHEVVIVGGGVSGLCAAYRLRDRDLLVLEKEPRLGGNCTLDTWEGVRMSTGGAFYTESETELVAFFAEIGAKGGVIHGGDSLVVDGEPVTDFFRDGAQKLPFAQRVRDDFRRSREELLALYKSRPAEELDALSFADLLKPYAAEVRRFWDRFGPSNWGSDAANTSGYVGCEAYTWAGGADDTRWTFPGGLAGATDRLVEVLTPKLGDRLRTGCAVVRVESEGKGAKKTVLVHYLQGDELRAVRARAVILSVPKFFAKRIVAGLPPERVADMTASRYAPFPVFNVCLGSAGPEPAYDNFFLDEPFTDFISADWVIHAGHGPPDRKTALTVYHPLREPERQLLLIEDNIVAMAERVAERLETHFPGTMAKIAEIRAFTRGHPMMMSTPGHMAVAERAAAPLGPILFANTDSGYLSTFDGAHAAAERTAKQARALLR